MDPTVGADIATTLISDGSGKLIVIIQPFWSHRLPKKLLIFHKQQTK